MKVLVIGGGGREHALVWKIAQSPLVKKIYCAPGNAGISQQAECVPIPSEDAEGLVAFAVKQRLDLTVVGPEAPLASGIADTFRKKGLPIFGPNKRAAEIEASKVFAKSFMEKYGISSAEARIFDRKDAALGYVKNEAEIPIVIKADGLAAGKGVTVAKTREEALSAVEDIMGKKSFGEAGEKILVEECLVGRELSALALTDGKNVVPLPLARDHKRVGNGDTGPNTGGMGAVSPVPSVGTDAGETIRRDIFEPVVRAMEKEDRTYRGVLYAGLMVTEKGMRVLEFNCRFGDPETQPILCLIEGDIVPMLIACSGGRIREGDAPKVKEEAAACVVMASSGYPGTYEKGFPISGLDEVGHVEGVRVFHAGTTMENGRYVTSGGRVLGVTGTGATLSQAISRAYEAVGKISWAGAYFRRDIGSGL